MTTELHRFRPCEEANLTGPGRTATWCPKRTIVRRSHLPFGHENLKTETGGNAPARLWLSYASFNCYDDERYLQTDRGQPASWHRCPAQGLMQQLNLRRTAILSPFGHHPVVANRSSVKNARQMRLHRRSRVDRCSSIRPCSQAWSEVRTRNCHLAEVFHRPKVGSHLKYRCRLRRYLQSC